MDSVTDFLQAIPVWLAALPAPLWALLGAAGGWGVTMMTERSKRREQRQRDETARLHEVQDRNESRLREAIANVITRANDYDVAFSLILEEEQTSDTPTPE